MRRPSLVPVDLLELARTQAGLVTTAQAERHAVNQGRRATLVRGGLWLRVARGVYDVDPSASSLLDADGRRRRAAWTALLAFGPEAIAVGSCALVLHGVQGLPVEVAPEAAIPRGRDRTDRAAGLVRLREFDNGMETVEVAGRRVATVPWALAQAVPELPRGCAVALMDSALHLGLIDERELDRAHRLARGRRGVARTHEWWCLADGRAESPLETAARLELTDLGVPPDELQVELRDAGGYLLGRGDLGWRLADGRWLIAELDGREWHEAPDALFRDRSRQNDLVGVAVVLRFTSDDVRSGRLVRTVRHHLRLHGRRHLPTNAGL